MHKPILPGIVPWLTARGVSLYVAQRVSYLNRNVDSDMLRKIERRCPVYAAQAAEAIELAFDHADTREGAEHWRTITRALHG